MRRRKIQPKQGKGCRMQSMPFRVTKDELNRMEQQVHSVQRRQARRQLGAAGHERTQVLAVNRSARAC
jgi:hypothetical protein